jgi:hypothetical protein
MWEISLKNSLLVALLTSSTLLANVCLAEETAPAEAAQTFPLPQEIPIQEKAFVDAINKFDKAAIVAQFGEPAKADDVKLKDSGKVVASIWHYHNINTAEDGSYYPTTELDFIDDKVVQVVFLNHDGSEANDGKTYELPQAEPNM